MIQLFKDRISRFQQHEVVSSGTSMNQSHTFTIAMFTWQSFNINANQIWLLIAHVLHILPNVKHFNIH